MIRRSTWVIIIIFVLVIGMAVLVEKTPYFQPSPTTTPTSAPRLLISSISALQLVDANGPTVSIKRDAKKTWVAEQPQNALVDQGNITELESQLMSLEILSTPQPSPPADATGLQSPAETITITDTANQQHILKIGKQTPTSSGYYAQMDQGKPVVVSKTTIDRIVELLGGVRATPTAPPQPTSNPPATLTPEASTPTATP
jgi:hypothetical protein